MPSCRRGALPLGATLDLRWVGARGAAINRRPYRKVSFERRAVTADQRFLRGGRGTNTLVRDW